MVDERKFSTEDLIGQQIWNKPAPVTEIPDNRESVNVYYKWDEDDDLYDGTPEEWSRENFERILEDTSKTLHCSEYYGIPYIWKVADDEYHGNLLQYRNVTERRVWKTKEEAILWFMNIAERCAG